MLNRLNPKGIRPPTLRLERPRVEAERHLRIAVPELLHEVGRILPLGHEPAGVRNVALEPMIVRSRNVLFPNVRFAPEPLGFGHRIPRRSPPPHGRDLPARTRRRVFHRASLALGPESPRRWLHSPRGQIRKALAPRELGGPREDRTPSAHDHEVRPERQLRICSSRIVRAAPPRPS